jgi:protein-S-isoprenylcysteine O-methyltransferase Ste14
MESTDDKRGAGVKVPPPLIALSFLLLGWWLDSIWAIDMGFLSGFSYIGSVFSIAGIALIVVVIRSFKKVATNIEPWKPTSTIVTTGVYAYSRNPIYLGFCLIILGLGLYFNSFWIFIMFLPTGIFISFLAIQKEERYLERKFGKEYCDYKNDVRRWL